MSLTANRFTTVAATARVLEAETDGLITDYLVGRRSWREDLRPSPDFTPRRSWDRPGVEALVEAGAADFETATGVWLPLNIAKDGPWDSYPKEGRIVEREDPRGAYQCEPGTAGRMVSEAARFGGFLRGIAADPLLVELVRRTTSPRGCNSLATTISLGILAERWTPGALSRQARQVRARANEVLAPYGLRVSWRALGQTLEHGPRRTGKAAVWATAMTLGWDPCRWSYADARAWLASVSRSQGRKVRIDDGVTAGIDLRRAQTIDGVTAIPASWSLGTHRRTAGYLCVRGRETYHAQADTARRAVELALDAWERRRTVRAKRLARKERLRNVSVLVYREDSLAAGNCPAGTDAFARDYGWTGRWYVTDDEVLATGNRLAANVAAAAQRAVLAQMAA